MSLRLSTVVNGITYSDIPPNVEINLGEFPFIDVVNFWITNDGPKTETVHTIEVISSPSEKAYMDTIDNWHSTVIKVGKFASFNVVLRDYGDIHATIIIKTNRQWYYYNICGYLVVY